MIEFEYHYLTGLEEFTMFESDEMTRDMLRLAYKSYGLDEHSECKIGDTIEMNGKTYRVTALIKNGLKLEEVEKKVSKMEIMKLITKVGFIYFSADYSPRLIEEILKRCPDWKSIELINMMEEEYRQIPATNESAELFR